MGKLGIVVILLLLEQISAIARASQKEDQKEAILKELVEIWRKGGGWNPHRVQPPVEIQKDQQIHSIVRSIMGGLKSLGVLPRKSTSLPSLNKAFDRNRLSGFLYNISMYLQEMSAEIDDRQQPFSDDQFWENLLYSLLQTGRETSLGIWDGKSPPRPTFRLQDLFLSLRGSPHWDGLLGLVQSILTLTERQPQKPILTFVSQNWKTISALLETVLQAMVSGTYGQAVAGLHGFICVLKGRNDCAFNLSWLEQLISFMETRNWKPVLSLHPVSVENNQRDSTLSTGRFKPFFVPPEVLHEEQLLLNKSGTDSESLASMQALLLQALSRSNAGERAVQFAERNPALLQGLDNLRHGFLHNVGRTVYSNLRRKVSHMTKALLDDVSIMVGESQYSHHGRCSVGDLRQLILWGIRHNLTWNAQAMGFRSDGLPRMPSYMTCPSPEEETRTLKPQHSFRRPKLHKSQLKVHEQSDSNPSPSSEILEAACNDSIPGLTGVSNFTVFLYCNLFDGEGGSEDSEVNHYGVDLHATCSDAAWYLSAAEEDFLWAHVCSEFFTHEFNKTVCANSTFWLQHAHQVESTRDYHYLNQSSIDDLCLQLSNDVSGGSPPDATEDCLALLSSKTLTAQDFRRCFLPNNTALIASLCGIESSQMPQDGSWAAEYCSKIPNDSNGVHIDNCDYSNWKAEQFMNFTALELCRSKAGLKDSICKNISLYLTLVLKLPSLLDYCLNSEETQGAKCVLQKLFDMLPAPYDFDTSQLCVNPFPILQEAIHKLTLCEGVMDERTGWLATVSYVLRVLDFVVGLSAGLEEGEREVRQGLGQAILLSSLQDNASFWATLRPDASISVLHTVAVYLKREQNSTLKEDLLSCFSQPVLWDLIQRGGNSSALRFLMQEYLQMPRESIRSVVLSAEKDAVKRFLSQVHQSWDQLQVETIQVSPKEQEAMETMTAAFIHKFPRVTPELFIDLSQFIPYMSVSDIMTFPASLMVNESVLMAIRDHSSEMKSPQKQAFVKRLLQSSEAGDVPTWPPYFLSSILPLLPHLPVSHFQQLTSQQLTPLMEMLGNSSLDATRGHHVLRSVFARGKNLTSDNIMRLGVLVCYLDSEDLHQLLSSSNLSPILWQQLARCVSGGHVSGSGRLSHWLGMALNSLNATILSASAMASLHGMLPQMGATFLEPLSSSELMDLVILPGMPTFPPAQAFQILNKIAEGTNFSANTLCRLKPLFLGLGPSFLRKLVVPESTPDCRCWSSLLSDLQPAHRAMVHFALQQGLERTSANITQQLQCLLPFVSLKKLMSDLNGETVLQHIPLYKHMPWSHQQAQMLFKMIQRTVNITRETLLDLGRIAGGMSCDWLKLWVNESGFSELLQFLTKLPGGLRTGLRKCIVVELRKQPDINLNDLDPSFAARLPLTMMEHLSTSSFLSVLDYVQQHFIEFLQLPRHKQTALGEKAIDVLGISEDGLTGSVMDMLGPLLPFLDSDVLSHMDREALKLQLEELKQYCFPSDTFRHISALLTERGMLGEPKTWTVGDVEHVGRLVFTLSPQQIRSLPLVDLGRDTVEQVLMSQWLWKNSEVGKACLDLKGLREKMNGLIHRIINGRWWMRRGPIPSCADIKGTFPSAWRYYQLNRMKRRELKTCVEFIGQDDTLDAEQREALWMELRPVYKPVKQLKPEQVLELGCIVTEMGERELQAVNLSSLAVVAHLGSLNGWSTKKMRAVVLGIMKRLQRKPEELDVVELVSLGHLLCGFSSSEISRLDPSNLSVAALFLREMVLPCSEQQTEALTSRLSNPLGFGPVSSWGSEVFTEIGTLAAGLEDVVLSALIKEQVEGLTPTAITLIPPRKLAVVFSATQLSWLSSEQACAVTEEQWAELDSEQRQALGMAQYEGELMLEHRGRNQAPSLRSASSFTKCLLLFVCTLWILL
ncbi:stereocilin isoform X1 [Siphateles boraxobius]|uniref:stereocilin isoform X1 n=1 Tax=Siphateles boraxobius TaxID=180520 RepID=UPI0040644BD4